MSIVIIIGESFFVAFFAVGSLSLFCFFILLSLTSKSEQGALVSLVEKGLKGKIKMTKHLERLLSFVENHAIEKVA